jgi:hypothetical protein
MLVFAVLLAFAGYIAADDSMSAVYTQRLQEYDQSIDNLKDSAETASRQLEDQQRYCDNSVYMKIDSQKVGTANVQYTASGDGSSSLASSVASYVNGGSLLRELADAVSDMEPEYLKELISASASGSVLSVTIVHTDQASAETLINLADEKILAYAQSRLKTDQTFTKVDSTSYVNADSSVLDKQNDNLSTLKGYQSNLSDIQSKIIEKETARDKYKSDYVDGSTTTASARRLLINYAFIGALIGLLIPLVWFVLKCVIHDEISDEKELSDMGIPVLGRVSSHMADAEIQNLAECIVLLAGKHHAAQIFLYVTDKENSSFPQEESLRQSLADAGILLTIGRPESEDTDTIKQMLTADNCIVAVCQNHTGWSQLNGWMTICEKMGVPVWGSIVMTEQGRI